MSDAIACPDPTCQAPARIVGPVEHVKTSCERGHWFTPTLDSLRPMAEQARGVPAVVGT